MNRIKATFSGLQKNWPLWYLLQSESKGAAAALGAAALGEAAAVAAVGRLMDEDDNGTCGLVFSALAMVSFSFWSFRLLRLPRLLPGFASSFSWFENAADPSDWSVADEVRPALL